MSIVDKAIDSVVAWRDVQRRKRWVKEHDAAVAKAERCELKDSELIYAATARCPCGAGLAYATGIGPHGFWDCSDILTGRAAATGQPESKPHCARYPFAFWSITSESQPSAHGATTRPK